MQVRHTELPGCVVIEPDVFGDERGWFLETWSGARYAAAGVTDAFVQDNMSFSTRGTLRGLHLQHPFGQGKLVYVCFGEVFDVAVDVRVGSPTFGRWTSTVLSGSNHVQMYIPPGFAHGFCVTSDCAIFQYKCTNAYHPECEVGVAFDDPALGIPWPAADPILSPKDRAHVRLDEIAPDRLPQYRTP